MRRTVNRRFFNLWSEFWLRPSELNAFPLRSFLSFLTGRMRSRTWPLSRPPPPTKPPSFRLRLVMEPFHLSTLIVHSPSLRHLPPRRARVNMRREKRTTRYSNCLMDEFTRRGRARHPGIQEMKYAMNVFFDLGRPFCYQRKWRRPRPQLGVLMKPGRWKRDLNQPLSSYLMTPDGTSACMHPWVHFWALAWTFNWQIAQVFLKLHKRN